MEEKNEHLDQNEGHDDCSDCGCGEKSSMDEVVSGNAFVLNTLIDLLIDKKIISEDELTTKLKEMQDQFLAEEMEDSDDELDEDSDDNLEESDEDLDDESEEKTE
jgi:hypothetical protein